MTEKVIRLHKLFTCVLTGIILLSFFASAGAETAESVPALVKDPHIRYIQGPGDGLFYPAKSLTRAETVTILNNILEEADEGSYPSAFSDVPEDMWYAPVVRRLASYGVIHGYPDGSFRPSGAVTRAEFVTMLVNMTGAVPEEKESGPVETEALPEEAEADGSGEIPESDFTDIEGSWAQEAILAAVGQGWILGYPEENGTHSFRPNRTITRAEAVTICNRILDREADPSVIYGSDSLCHFPDVREKDWFYADIMEAATGHSHKKTDNGEIWTDYQKESTGLSQGLHAAGGLCFTVDAAGRPEKYSAGYYLINRMIYHAREEGYALYREAARGLVTLEGRAYLSDGNALISGPAGFYDFDGYTYYINDNGTIAVNRSVQSGGKTYRFDAKGRLMTALRAAVENSRTAERSGQIVLVTGHTLTFWCRAEDGSWRKLMDTYCGYGSKGFADADSRKMGSLTTPIGAFPIGIAFGTGTNPGTALEYRQITKNSYWADATNGWMESTKKLIGEHLIDYPQYKYAVEIGFNRDPYVPERGSAIFIHCKGSRSWSTAGCVSLREDSMLSLMKQLKPGAYIIIVKEEKDLAEY